MKKRINTILWSNKEPKDKNILWLNDKKLYFWNNKWEPILGQYNAGNIVLSDYLTKEDASKTYQPKGEYVSLSEVNSILEYIEQVDLILGDYISIVDRKQDKLISGFNIKTINGHSLLGEGDIIITGNSGGVDIDLSSYLTKDLAAETYQLKGNYASKLMVEELQDTVNFIDEELGRLIDNIAHLQNKLDKLVPGEGIQILGNTISCVLDTSLYEVVTKLPETGKSNKIYLLPNENTFGQNMYVEYVYIENHWEILGEHKATIELDDYVTKLEFSDFIGGNLDSGTIKELENLLYEVSNETATLNNTVRDIENELFVLNVSNDTGTFNDETINKIKKSKFIVLDKNNTTLNLTARAITDTSILLIFNSIDAAITSTSYISIDDKNQYVVTTEYQDLSEFNEIYIWNWDGEDSGTFAVSEWPKMLKAKLFIINLDGTYYIPSNRDNSTKSVLKFFVYTPNVDGSVVQEIWLFESTSQTWTYEEYYKDVDNTKLSQFTNDVGFITEEKVDLKLSQFEGLNTNEIINQITLLKKTKLNSKDFTLEQGTWVPILTGKADSVDMHVANGTYIKLGDTCICNFTFSYQTILDSAVELNITGLPYTPKKMYSWRAGSGYLQGYANQATHSFGGWLVNSDGIIHARGFAYSNGAMTKMTVGNGEWVDGSGIIMFDIKDNELPVKAINHRGYSTEAPENTIPAYILSAEKGYTYVETDVGFTKDGVAVLLHDNTIDRTSDGTGNLSDLYYKDLLQYDFGSWFDIKYSGTKIPTFDEFLDCCKAYNLKPYIELKGDSDAYSPTLIMQIVDMVVAKDMLDKSAFISFSIDFLTIIKLYCPIARLGYLINPTRLEEGISNTLSLRTNDNNVFANMRYDLVTNDIINTCKSNYLPLEIWTVNDESVIKSMDSYISGVTSDNLIAENILNPEYTIEIPDISNDKLLYYIPGSGFKERTITAASPYQSTVSNYTNTVTRISNVSNVLTVPSDTDIKIEFEGNVPLNGAVWVINSTGASKVISLESLTASDKIDTGWLESGYIFNTGANASYIWLNVKRLDNAVITTKDINYFKISLV